MNQINLIGNIGRAPELTESSSGRPLLRFSLAVDRHFFRTEPNGRRIKMHDTDWFDILIWGDEATAQAERLQKGSQIRVSGRARVRTTQDRRGNRTQRIEVHANEIQYLRNIRNPERESPTARPEPSPAT